MNRDARRPPPRELPQEQSEALRRAERLCWWTLVVMGLVATMMYFVMGGSQAMKTALVEDILSLVPPAAFLVASRFRRKGVDEEYTTGRERAFDINFLISSVALTGVGLALVYDGLHTLLTATRPVVGTMVFGGKVVWQGWIMMAAMVISVVPPVILGRKKMKLAEQLSLKPLHTDADVGKADWMTGLAGIAGVAGIGMGWWWADAAAALFIAASVLHDGSSNLRAAVRDLHDARPQKLDRSDPDPLPDELCRRISALPWVEGCAVRLHEEGFHLSGIVLLDNASLSAAQAEEIRQLARSMNWRVDAVDVTLR
ncbi:cation diffusion facilitator family transporter [Pseudoxanthomonas suwonensis 11-1]|uniref:Cation diffusion facilitator family transporter n=1 Tax=Pseudoxanthomonas suwonensis (strain 11-1) TaxID=743721 RepID=E6WV27_PSEUU|nr:cation transporter [Pseudoxanthomonas suwonensis]ADV28026.1 cation diffusion facilitator family transporter [Pseudoxanthomonas suwonensis 11-1]